MYNIENMGVPGDETKQVSSVHKPTVQNVHMLQIQEVHPMAHSSACNFCHFLSIFSPRECARGKVIGRVVVVGVVVVSTKIAISREVEV